MPWKVEKGHGCPASKPWAVVKESDGSVEGCHATKAKAEKQQAALYANEGQTNMTHPPAVDVVRAVTVGPELRHDATDGLGRLVVRFSKFDTWYEVDSFWEGTFQERTKRGAFKQTIREDRDRMRVLFDHGFDFQVGNKVLGPIDDLREDPDSPVGEVAPLFDTSYNRDLLPGLEAGVYGSSMRMRVLGESWDDEPEPSDDNPKGLPERTITRVKVLEFGPVTFPANPDATAEMSRSAVRSLTDYYYDHLRQRDASAFEAAVRCAQRSTPDFTGQPGARSAGGGEHGRAPGNGSRPDPSDDPSTRDRVLRALGVLQ